MNLLKKTVALSGNIDGYLSVVRVGDEVGLKVVGEAFSPEMTATVRLGDEVLSFPLAGKKTEWEYECVDYRDSDPVGCVIKKEGVVLSRGGAAIKEVAEKITPEAPKDPVEESAEIERQTGEEEGKEELFSRLSSTGASYYNGVREKLDELFVIHPSEPELNAAFPESEWIKIRYDGEDYYVVGRLKENGKVTLLGYGVPGKKAVSPPKVTLGAAHFLELPALDGYDGYWLIFQDAETGKTVKNEEK